MKLKTYSELKKEFYKRYLEEHKLEIENLKKDLKKISDKIKNN